MVADNPELFERIIGVSDRVEQELGYSYRDQNGYLHEKGFLCTTIDNKRLSKAFAEECGDEITSFLMSKGICAEITPFAHLVIDFSRSSPEHYKQYFPVL
jgi:hypothetical protein